METQSRVSSLGLTVRLSIVASAVGALVSMFIVGQRQRSVLLITMFVVWVLAPYVALWLLNARARAWNPSARATVAYASVLISLGALARYAWVLVWPLAAQPASTFLIVPFASCVAIVVAAAIAMRSSRTV